MSTIATTPARLALLSVACPRCGAGQGDGCIARSGHRYGANESHTARVDAARRAGVREKPSADDRWTVLREEIRQERAAQSETGDGHAELGHRDESERAYGAVEALDRLLVTMERMEQS